MKLTFDRAGAYATAVITDVENAGPDGRRHVEVSGRSTNETTGRALAEEIKQVLTKGREVHWRVPFEYKQEARGVHLFGRFSFR